MKNHNVSGSGQEQNTRTSEANGREPEKSPMTAICKATKASDFIVFEDPVMKEMCIKAFDMDGDGELSYAEAAAVTDLGKMKLTNRDFRSFNEFQYFTSVKAIPDRYYEDCRNLASIVIPDSVTNIGNLAFYICISLANIVIPNSVTSIGDWAFKGCRNLASIVIPNSVTSIGKEAFYICCSLESIVIPESVTSIREETFSWCDSLKSIVIPDSVTSIEDLAFYQCESLESIVIPDSVTSIGEAAFGACYSLSCFEGKYSSSDKRYLIIDGTLVAFAPQGLKEYTIPSGVKSIGNGAFSDCDSLESIVIPDSVTSIGEKTFSWCDSLASIVIPESVTSIGEETFSWCDSLKSIVIPDSVTNIGDMAFYDCRNLASIVIPDSVTNIGNWAFVACSNLACFEGKYSSSDKRCLIMDGTLVAVAPQGLTEYTIPSGVKSIGNGAFYRCSKLESIVIPNSVTNIGNGAFCQCESLKNFYVRSENLIDISKNTFSECNGLKKIYVPEKSVKIYKEAESWRDYASLIEGCDFSESVDQSHEKIHITKEESNEKNLITYLKELLFGRFSHIRHRK